MRIGVMWQSVEPQRGQYNMTFLEEVKKVVDHLGRHDIYTILDGHQDLLHRAYCGEGFPSFAVEAVRSRYNHSMFGFPSPIPAKLERDEKGMPSLDTCMDRPFAQFYASFEEADAWNELYRSTDLQAAFGAYWGTVASVFQDSPYVLAYELLNEPSVSLRRLFKSADELLLPLYKEAHAQIRKHDTKHLIMYETFVVNSYIRRGSGFAELPDGPQAVYAYHVYCAGQNATGDIPPGIAASFCKTALSWSFDTAMKDLDRLKSGAFMSEFGALGPHKASADMISFLLDKADAKSQSWAYWSFKRFHDFTTQNANTETLYNDDGSLQTEKVKALARPFPQKTDAIPSSVKFEFVPSKALFRMSFSPKPRAAAKGKMEVRTVLGGLGALQFPGGLQVHVSCHPAYGATVGGDLRLSLVSECGSLFEEKQTGFVENVYDLDPDEKSFQAKLSLSAPEVADVGCPLRVVVSSSSGSLEGLEAGSVSIRVRAEGGRRVGVAAVEAERESGAVGGKRESLNLRGSPVSSERVRPEAEEVRNMTVDRKVGGKEEEGSPDVYLLPSAAAAAAAAAAVREKESEKVLAGEQGEVVGSPVSVSIV
eukprot:Cvel_168.t2-p1 / transcript=Cvel_168.t2 / gene=Cvel_168 / organism=Chromera_velia_CCMP2878 / gene_product=Endoglycoceramidase, putative / transcript_product=Endoglycoceramidase, putative / location=Cvel_scaffold10:218514-220292(+) / protein_length=593 / sequence_SO=supercontig / SO=protein_coding / is_pseudo=false